MSRIDEIKKRHKERRNRMAGPAGRTSSYFEQQPMNLTKKTNGNGLTPTPPLFRSQTFIFKCLIAAGLVLATGIFFKTYAKAYPEVEKVIHYAMTEDVNFAKVSEWYEKSFGEPLALFPSKNNSTEKVTATGKDNFAVPVNGTITKGFSDTKQGVYIQTDVDAKVDAIESGFVVSVGEKDGIGKTVVIRHSDGAESWYGNLATVDVKPYDFVKREQNIGTVTTASGKKTGTFYFALKEGDHFVDPIQVIQFE
jgi:stage IV sporulation protein FA